MEIAEKKENGMTSFAGFFIGLGIFLGLACIAHGLLCIAISIKEHRK